jgi:hypothetical protein
MEHDQMKKDELDLPFPWKGHKQACGRIAGTPAAADVERLSRIRDGKLFWAKGVNWTEFCKQYAGVGREYADQLIRELKEFGPNYFHLSRIVPISAETYRQFGQAVSGEGIAFGGEIIAITPDNRHKIAKAVKALRDGAPEKRTACRVQAARNRLEACVEELGRLRGSLLSGSEGQDLERVIRVGRREMKELSMK